MTFLWPEMLLLLLLVPVLVGAYFFVLHRKKQAALRNASWSIVKDAMSARQKFRRHIPPLLFLISMTAMFLAIARPAAIVTLPSQHRTIILAMDVSGSMRAADVQPSRIASAQASTPPNPRRNPAIPSTRIVAMKAKIVSPAKTRAIEVRRVASFEGTVSSPVSELVTTAR